MKTKRTIHKEELINSPDLASMILKDSQLSQSFSQPMEVLDNCSK